MIINNVELQDIDILDADEAEKFESAIEKVKKIENVKCSKNSEAIRLVCNAIFDCFNDIFGEGTDREIFGNKVNLMTCLNAFEELVMHMKSQNEELEKFSSKYSSNRASRRKK